MSKNFTLRVLSRSNRELLSIEVNGNTTVQEVQNKFYEKSNFTLFRFKNHRIDINISPNSNR